MSSPGHLGIRQTQTQRLALNNQLMTALGVLRSDAAGLTRFLEEQAAQNPHLRLIPAPPPAPGDWLPRWRHVLASQGGGNADLAQSAGPSLMAHVGTRIEMLLPRGRSRDIAFALAEALEPSGWLGRPLPLLSADLHASLAEIGAVLTVLQKIEPAGLFARNLAECLQLQLAEAGQMDPVFALILGNLALLAQGDLTRLSRMAAVSETEMLRRFRIIRGLNPKPGTQFEGFAAEPLREPDLLVRREADGWQVALNRSALPSLQIVRAAAGSAAALAEARLLGRMVEARNTTLLRVARAVIEVQQTALTRGPSALVPLTMAEIAAMLELAESTISRVVAGVSVDTPLGTFWLRQLFVGRVASVSEDGPALSTAVLRAAIGQLIAGETAAAPLSDAAIVQGLALHGMAVARRTVAKYRGLLGIAPAHRRRRRGPRLHKA